MLRLFLSLTLIFTALLMSSCFKEDQQITPHTPGNFITDTVPMTDSYAYQVYYNLYDSAVESSIDRTVWDLGFESSPSGWRVILNTSCFMKTAYIAGQAFGAQVDTTGATWLFNPSDGSADSVAVGQWFTVNGNDTLGNNRLILIDRGVDVIGNPRGFSQMVMDSLVNGKYYFRLAALNGSNPKSYSISKHNDVNHVLFSISNPTTKITEPNNNSWDLLFTQYTTLLFTDAGDPYPYLLTGVLVNPKLTLVARDSITPFKDIDFEKAQSMNLTQQADKIGYDWKKYDFDAGTYTINSNLNYIIRDNKGFLYKLRFVGFYKFVKNRLQKGYPSFEYQKL